MAYYVRDSELNIYFMTEEEFKFEKDNLSLKEFGKVTVAKDYGRKLLSWSFESRRKLCKGCINSNFLPHFHLEYDDTNLKKISNFVVDQHKAVEDEILRCKALGVPVSETRKEMWRAPRDKQRLVLFRLDKLGIDAYENYNDRSKFARMIRGITKFGYADSNLYYPQKEFLLRQSEYDASLKGDKPNSENLKEDFNDGEFDDDEKLTESIVHDLRSLYYNYNDSTYEDCEELNKLYPSVRRGGYWLPQLDSEDDTPA